MKHKGAVMEYSMERMNDLMRAYDEYISSCDYIRMPEVYKVIVNMPSRRFWVSDIRAALVVSVMMRGENDLSGMRPLRKKCMRKFIQGLSLSNQNTRNLPFLSCVLK